MATKIVSDDLSYYIKVNNKKRCLPSDAQQQCNAKTTKLATTKELAHAWLENGPGVHSELLAAMALLKRQLAFSIDTFVEELDLTRMTMPQLASTLVSYHSWSRQAHGILPLISLLLPLIQASSTSASLMKCFHDLTNQVVMQDYLEAIVAYLAIPSPTLNKAAVQHWLDALFEQYRLTLAHYSSSSGATDIASLDLYTAYFDLLADTRRLKCLSWQERKQWIEKEWLAWVVENQYGDPLERWMLAKSDMLLNQVLTDLEVDLLLDKNIVWLSESGNMNNLPVASSRIFDRLIGWYTIGKVPNMRLIYGMFGKHCVMLTETGHDSTEIIGILEQAQQLILQHLQGATDKIALVMSMVQIALHHMDSLLSYTQWFQSTFINTSSTCLKSKHQCQLWMKHMETMIPYETTTILQVHAKALADSSGPSNYVSLVKTKLLALGVDATLRQYPARLDTPLLPELLHQHHDTTRGGSGLMRLQPADLKQLVDDYGATELVPQALLEASIFRPKWFKQTFLPALMMEWKPTEALTLARRDHMVKTFQRKGKVPSSLLAQYQPSQK